MSSRRERERRRLSAALPLLASFTLLLLALTVWVCARSWDAASVLLRRWGNGVTAALGRLWSFLPLPLSEVLLILLPPAAVALLIVRGVRGGWRRLRVTLCRMLCLVCALVFLFVSLYGVQYSAPSLASRLGLTVRDASVDQLEQTTAALVAQLNELAPAVPRDGNGACRFGSFEEQAALVMTAWDSLTARWPAFGIHRVAAPRRSRLLGVAQSYLGNAGYFFPWTGESVVSSDSTPTQYAYDTAHESAHARGVGPEAECNFLAYLVCLRSEDVRLRYSGVFNAYIYAGNALYAADRTRWQALYATLCDEAKLDLRALNAQVHKYDGPAKNLGDAVNDRFIKATGQPDGLRSYGLMVDLLIAWNEQEGT